MNHYDKVVGLLLKKVMLLTLSDHLMNRNNYRFVDGNFNVTKWVRLSHSEMSGS